MIKKYFTEKQIYLATFFGGPIPPGILIYKNFKRINEDKKAALTIILTLVFTFLLFLGLMQIPDAILDKIPNVFFTSVYTAIVYLVYRNYLADTINEKIVEDENKSSNWSVAGITFLGLAINLIIIFALAMSQPTFPGEKLTFGISSNEIFYEEEVISEDVVLKTGDLLMEIGFFTDEHSIALKLEKKYNKLQLLIPMDTEWWEDAEILAEFNYIKDELEFELKQDIEIVLIHYMFDGKELTKTI